MPSKLENIVNLYSETLSDISRSSENWASFLLSASSNYKYGFQDQVLIFVQRPDATACASIETWNKQVKRWVNKGAKGIALLNEVNGRNTLKHVFDVSDTHNYYGTKLNLWKVEDKYKDEIIESLEARFGALENKSDLASAIISASYNSVEDNIRDYLDDLISSKEDSFLEELDDFNIEVEFRRLLSNSVAYMTMNRCGINPFDYFTIDDFREITDFNTIDTISRLGVATSDIAETNLREIHNTIRNIKINEKNQNRTFVENGNMKDNIKKESERSEEYAINIQTSRGLSNSEFNGGGNKQESISRQILSNEVTLPEGTQKRTIYGFNDEKQTNRTFTRNTRNSNEKIKSNNARADETGEYNRRNESKRPNDLGTNDEQHQELSGGNNLSRDNLQLNLTSEEEQKKIIADMSNNDIPAIFDFTQEMIDKTLQEGSHFSEGKFRIYRQMTTSLSTKENIAFLKHEYGIGGASSAYRDAEIGMDYDAKGIRLHLGYKDNRPEKLLSWNEIEKRLKELVMSDRYLNQKEFDEYLVWLERDTQEKINQTKEIPVERVLDYHLGDIVYIGADQYEISKIGEFDIGLYDLKFPLFGREIPKEEFERKVKENPSNSHLYKLREILNTQENDENNFEENYKLPNGNYFHFHTNEEGYYYAIYDNKGTEIDGGLLEYSEIDNERQSIKDIRKRLAKFTEIAELENDNLENVTQDFIENLENDDYIKLENSSNEEIIQPNIIEATFEKQTKEKQTFNSIPEISNKDRINYKIIDDNLGVGTPKERFANNIEAIKILKKCEDENRLATKDEQEILAKYVGWGGLSNAFNKDDNNWSNEYNILKDLLTDEEFKNARASTLTAFYTPPIVIKSIYKVLENMGVKTANILEPSCGIGNFIGNVPETINNKIYGVEIDSVSGRIARQLYQRENIAISGFEKVDLPDSFFDVAIGNVPFGDFKVNDKKYDKNNFLIHDYFFRENIR